MTPNPNPTLLEAKEAQLRADLASAEADLSKRVQYVQDHAGSLILSSLFSRHGSSSETDWVHEVVAEAVQTGVDAFYQPENRKTVVVNGMKRVLGTLVSRLVRGPQHKE
jgi:hypothetical protein